MDERMSDAEAKVEQYINDGQTGKAFELLYQLAIESAKNKDFFKSEAFRDRLYEVDSFALSRIIEVNEAIETEKRSAILPDERKLWAPIFKGLGTNEASAFFLSLRKEVIDSETIIFEQGQQNDRLFLISQGQIKLLYSNENKEILIARMGRGDIFGEDTFFSVNVCTMSAKALTEVHIEVMDRAIFERLKSQHHTLESNLKKVLGSKRSVHHRLRQKGLDRRAYKRINWNIMVLFQLLSASDKNVLKRSVKAELWDISKGGLSFYFQSKNPSSVRSLIGQNIGVRLDLKVDGKSKTIALSGVVHGVQSHPMEEYSVHLQFNRRLSDKAIRTIEMLATTS